MAHVTDLEAQVVAEADLDDFERLTRAAKPREVVAGG